MGNVRNVAEARKEVILVVAFGQKKKNNKTQRFHLKNSGIFLKYSQTPVVMNFMEL